MENPFFLSILHKAVYKEKEKFHLCNGEKKKKASPWVTRRFLFITSYKA